MMPQLWMASGSLFQTVGTAEEKRHAAILEHNPGTVSKSISAWLIEPVCFVAQGGNPKRKAASDKKPMQVMKEIYSVLLKCGYVADGMSKLVLDSLQLVERLLNSIM